MTLNKSGVRAYLEAIKQAKLYNQYWLANDLFALLLWRLLQQETLNKNRQIRLCLVDGPDRERLLVVSVADARSQALDAKFVSDPFLCRIHRSIGERLPSNHPTEPPTFGCRTGMPSRPADIADLHAILLRLAPHLPPTTEIRAALDGAFRFRGTDEFNDRAMYEAWRNLICQATDGTLSSPASLTCPQA